MNRRARGRGEWRASKVGVQDDAGCIENGVERGGRLQRNALGDLFHPIHRDRAPAASRRMHRFAHGGDDQASRRPREQCLHSGILEQTVDGREAAAGVHYGER
jgi:hypothetical protein